MVFNLFEIVFFSVHAAAALNFNCFYKILPWKQNGGGEYIFTTSNRGYCTMNGRDQKKNPSYMCACEKKVYLTINNRAENPLKTPAATTINEFTGEKKVRYASIPYMRKTNKYYKRRI